MWSFSASPDILKYDQCWQVWPLVGLKYSIFSSLWLFPLIFLLRWPNRLMNSLNCLSESMLHKHQLTYWNWPKEINWYKEGERESMREKWWGGGIIRSLNKRKSMQGEKKKRETIFLARLSTWTLARTSSKSFYLSAHPNNRAGWRRVMEAGWTCAASVRHAPHSWAGSAVAALIGWWFTPPLSGVSEAVCDAFCEEWNDIWQMLVRILQGVIFSSHFQVNYTHPYSWMCKNRCL